MKKFFLFCFCCYLAAATVWAQSPQLSRKVDGAVFTLLTFDREGAALSRNAGFFTSAEGGGVTNLQPLIGAATAAVVTEAGDTFAVRSVTGMNFEADVARIETAPTEKAVFDFLPLTMVAPKRTDKLNVWEARGARNAYLRQLPVTITKKEKDFTKLIFNVLGIMPGNPVVTENGLAAAIITPQGAIALFETDFFKPLSVKSDRWKDFLGKKAQIIDRVCPADAQLRLDAIEHLPAETRLHFTYTNWQLLSEAQSRLSGYRSLALLFNENEGLVLKENPDTAAATRNDKKNKKSTNEYPAFATTLSTDPNKPTLLEFGKPQTFYVSFNKAPEAAETLHLFQGKHGAWSFTDIQLLPAPDSLAVLPQKKGELETANLYKHLGLARFQNREYSQAVELLEKHLASAPQDAEAHNFLAIACYQMAQPATHLDSLLKALSHIEKAIEIDGARSVHLLYNRARIFGSVNGSYTYGREVDDLRVAVNKSPYQATYRRDLAYALHILARNNEALAQIDTLFLDKKNTWFDLMLRGNARFDLGFQETACKDWEKAYAVSSRQELIDVLQEKCMPANVKNNQPLEYYIQNGNKQFDRKDYLNAVANYQMAIRLKPTETILYYLRGKSYFYFLEQKRNSLSATDRNFYINCALKDLNKCVTMFGLPNDLYSSAYYLKGQTFKMLDNRLDAIADLSKAVNGGNLPAALAANGWQDLGDLYLSMNNRYKACESWQKAAGFNLKAANNQIKLYCANLQPDAAAPNANTLSHTVANGETLETIANQYHLTIEELKKLNQLTTDDLKTGQILLIRP